MLEARWEKGEWPAAVARAQAGATKGGFQRLWGEVWDLFEAPQEQSVGVSSRSRLGLLYVFEKRTLPPVGNSG